MRFAIQSLPLVVASVRRLRCAVGFINNNLSGFETRENEPGVSGL